MEVQVPRSKLLTWGTPRPEKGFRVCSVVFNHSGFLQAGSGSFDEGEKEKKNTKNKIN